MDESLINIAGLAGLLAVVAKLVDFSRLLTNAREQKSAIVTQVLAWVVAIAAVFVYGASNLGDFLIPGTDESLQGAAGWTKVITGFAIGSTASFAVDLKQAIDHNDTSAKPPLIPPTPVQVVPTDNAADYAMKNPNHPGTF